MPTFRYIARSSSGERIEGSLEAADRRAAAHQLARMNAVPVSITESAEAPKPRAEAAHAPASPRVPMLKWLKSGTPAPRMNARERLLFTRELADLLASGMTLGDALHALSQRHDAAQTPADALVTHMRDQIVQGQSLSHALREHPETFPHLYVNVIRAGEASGALTETLRRLSEHYEREQEAREKIISAVTYPAIVMAFGIAMMLFLSAFVIPKFAKVFAEFGGKLPVPTRILMGISQWLSGFRGLAVAGVVVAAAVALRQHIRTPAGRAWWHRKQLTLPILRPIVSANAFAQFAETLGSLLRNGVPVLQALSIVEDTMGNVVLAAEVRAARERVTDGSTISGPLAAGGVFPRMLTDMLAVGERTGDLAGALGHIAHRYESERDRAMRMFMTILEPLMILSIALIVGFVAISMLMAVFDMTSGLAQ